MLEVTMTGYYPLKVNIWILSLPYNAVHLKNSMSCTLSSDQHPTKSYQHL